MEFFWGVAIVAAPIFVIMLYQIEMKIGKKK